MKNYIVTFHSHFDALMFCKYLKEKGIAARAMPTPRKLSAACGDCVSFSADSETFEGIDFSGFEVGKVFDMQHL